MCILWCVPLCSNQYIRIIQTTPLLQASVFISKMKACILISHGYVNYMKFCVTQCLICSVYSKTVNQLFSRSLGKYSRWTWENGESIKMKGRKLLLVTGTHTPPNLISCALWGSKVMLERVWILWTLRCFKLNLIYLFYYGRKAKDFAHLALNYTYWLSPT